MERQQDLKKFEEWYGLGDEGYKTERDAQRKLMKVDECLKKCTGQVSYVSEVVERIGYTGLWVHVVRVVDYNDEERLANGL